MITFEEFLNSLTEETYSYTGHPKKNNIDAEKSMKIYMNRYRMNIPSIREIYINNLSKFVNNNYDEILQNFNSTILGYKYTSSLQLLFNSNPKILCIVDDGIMKKHTIQTKKRIKKYDRFQHFLIIKSGETESNYFYPNFKRGIKIATYNKKKHKWSLLPLLKRKGYINWYCNCCGCTGIERYVCSTCDEYDICNSCIEIHEHDKTHKMIKYIGNWDDYYYDKAWILCKYDNASRKFKYVENLLTGFKPFYSVNCNTSIVKTVTI